MPTNLRPRVQEFDPFRRLNPGSPVNVDTYAQPAVDTDALNRSLSLLDSVKGLAPSVNRYLDRSFALQQEQTAAAAQAAIADLTPDQIRAESERDWEGISKARGIDNPWWKIRLDEAAGRSMGTAMADRLTARGLEASNPDEPNAHLRIVQEERAAATQGMNSFQRDAFEAEAENIQRRFVLTSSEQRESRTQAKIQQAFRDDVRGLVRSSLDPALGGAVDLTKLRATIESERMRSGNDGRAELFAALQDSITVAAAQADSDAELDALRLQTTAMLAEVGSESFGGEHPLSEVEAAQIDRLEVIAEREVQQREDFLRNKENKKQADAADEMDDFALALSAQVFDGSLDQGDATAQMLGKAQELATKYGVDSNYLVGKGRISLSNQITAVEQTRFAAQDDPATVKGLNDLLQGEDFNSGWFGVALSGAVADGKLSRKTYGDMLEIGTDGVVRGAQKAATGPVDALTRSFGERTIQLAKPMLDSIADPAKRDEAEALLLAEVDAIMAGERGNLANQIQQKGLDRSAEAVDAWTKDFLARSSALINDAVKDVQEKAGSWADPQLAFRSSIQEQKIYKPALEKWTRDYAEQALVGDDDTLFALGNSQVGALPVADAAQLIASGRYPSDNARAADIKREAEEAFLTYLGEKTSLGKLPVGESILSAETILRTGSFEVPKPASAVKAEANKAADEAAKRIAAGGTQQQKEAALSAESVQQIEAQIEGMKAQGLHPAVIEQQRVVLTKAEMEAEQKKVIAYYSSINAINGAVVLQGRQYLSRSIVVRDGHFYPLPSKGSVKDAVRLESEFIAGKLWTGLTLEEVKEGMAQVAGIGEGYDKPQSPSKVLLDRKTIRPEVVPFFQTVEALDAADLTEWLALFPGYTSESFKAAQREVIRERIPAQNGGSTKESAAAPKAAQSDYDMESAKAAGLTADATGHWPSRVPSGPKEGLLLKAETHPTFNLTVQGEREAGYTIYRSAKDGRLYSFKNGAAVPDGFTPYQP